jgi:PAS domain S-box-containing protein
MADIESTKSAKGRLPGQTDGTGADDWRGTLAAPVVIGILFAGLFWIGDWLIDFGASRVATVPAFLPHPSRELGARLLGAAISFGAALGGGLLVFRRRGSAPPSPAALFPFRQAFDASLDAVGVALDGIHLAVNPAYLALFGYSDSSELIGQPIIGLIAPECREQIGEFIRRRSGREEVPSAYLSRGRRRDGTTFDVDLHVTGFELDGRVYTLAILRDVTANLAAEALLRSSEEQHRRILEILPIAVVLHSEGKIRWANDATAKLLAIASPSELIGRPVIDFVHPEDRETVIARFARLVRGETVEMLRERFLRPDGGVVDVEVVATPFDENRPGLTLVAAIDTTEQRRAERVIERSERLLRESQAVARLGSYVLDIPGDVWTSSSILDEIFGIDASIPHTIELWTDILHPDSREEMAAYFRDSVIGGGNRFDRDYRIVRRSDGATRWVSGLGELDFDSNGRAIRMRGTIQDITERKLAEEALRERERELETWHDLVTHDLANFSMTLLGLVERMIEGADGPLTADQTDTLRRVFRQGFEMQRLAENAKLLARHRAGRLEPTGLGSADLSATIDEAIQTIRSVHFDREFRIRKEIPAGLRVRNMPFLVNVFLNLFDNALRHAPAHRSTEIVVRAAIPPEAPGQAVVAVRGGAPPPPDLLPQIFERYVRGPQSSGTGLGLSAVRELVVGGGGSATARVSTEAGEASFEIVLELPLADDER